jgi:hypothetical protein
MKDKINAMRTCARLMAFIWLCFVASLAGCSSNGLNKEPTGWSFPGKFPVDRGTVVIKDVPNATEQSWKQEARKIAKARWKLHKKRKKITRVSVEKGGSAAKDSRPQTFAPATMRTSAPVQPAQPVQPRAADSRAASSKPQSLQLRLRSFWSEAPPPGAFSR